MENHAKVNHPLAPPASAMDSQDILDNIEGRMHGPMNGLVKKKNTLATLNMPIKMLSRKFREPDGARGW